MTQQPDEPAAVHTRPRRDNSATESPGGMGVSRLWRRTAGAAAVVAVLVIGNATAAHAAPSTASTASTGSGGAAPGRTPTDATMDTTASSALHGEFKVVNRDGSAQLRRWQSGAVDSIDSMSMTVRSADGYDSTYLLGPGVSVTGIGVGDEVTVVGAGQAVAGNS